MTKKEWVLKAFNNEEVDRVPMSFWFHFVDNEAVANTFENPELLQQNLSGHKKYMEEVGPDFIKVMSDGYFRYPMAGGKTRLDTIDDLDYLKAVDASHPWIQKQVELVQQIVAMNPDCVYVYNTFSPAYWLKVMTIDGNATVLEFLKQDPERVAAACAELGKGISAMAEAVITKGGADGIYLCVQNPALTRFEEFSSEDYRKYITPSDKQVLNAAAAVGGKNILHICGYEGARNDLNIYTDYNPAVYHWAANVEGVSLADGKKLFGGAPVVGGFANGSDGLLNTGTKEEIQAFAKKLVQETGKKGYLMGADCSLPKNIDWERLRWVHEALAEI